MTHFNQVANKWDTDDKAKLASTMANSIIPNIELASINTILDFGCGTGLLSYAILDQYRSKNFKLAGIDTSDEMLNIMQNKNFPHIRTTTRNINLEQNNIFEKFDLIVSSMAFHHLIDPEQMLTKFSKLLNEKGTIIIIDLEAEDGSFHPDNEAMGVKHFGFSKDDLQAWATKINATDFKFKIIHSFNKNEKNYPLFMGIFTT